MRLVTGLTWVIGPLAAVCAAAGLWWRTAGEAMPFTTVRGERVELYGRGLYQYDTLFAAGGAHGNDAVVLLVGLPLLLITTMRARQGLRWRLLHLGVVGYFLYTYASLALGTVMFNPVFPAYVALSSASFFAVVLAASSIARSRFADRLSPAAPRRGLAAFLLTSAAITIAVWGLPLATALARGGVTPRLDSYTTEVTFALDLGLIAPALAVAAVQVLRRKPSGYLLATGLLALEVMLAPMIAAQTIGQIAAGVDLSAGEVTGPVFGFIALAGIAAWFLYSILAALPAARRDDTP